MTRLRWNTLLLAVTMVVVSACGALNLAGEPEIVATIPVPPTDDPNEALNTMPILPDLTRGAAIFAENCTSCHGTGGAGDGELVASGQINTDVIPNFTVPSESTPLERFWIVTNGRIENLMPPWEGSLDEYDRWAVTYYTFSLAYSEDQAAQGEAIAADLSFQDAAALNDSQVAAQFGDSLTEEEITAAVAYVRTQGMSVAAGGDTVVQAPEEAIAAPQETAEPEPFTTFNVSGSVLNGTPPNLVPEDVTVTLHIMDRTGGADTIETTPDVNGDYTFTDVPVEQEKGYVVSVLHDDHYFTSAAVPGFELQPEMDLPVMIFDITSDASTIEVTSVIYQIQPEADGLFVLQLMNATNTGDKMYRGENAFVDGVRYPSLSIHLPDGAQYVPLEADSARYVWSPEEQTVYDTRPVSPGDEHTVHLAYTIPYDGSVDLTEAFPYTMNGPAEVYVPQGMSINSDLLENIDLGASDQGFTLYAGELTLTAADSLAFTVTGTPRAAASSSSGFQLSRSTTAIILGVSGAVLILAAGIMLRLSSNPVTQEQLIEQIAELDERYQRSDIEESKYQKQRQRLKSQLASIMKKQATEN